MKYIILPFNSYSIDGLVTVDTYFKRSQSGGSRAGFGGPLCFAKLQVVGVDAHSPNLKSK